MKGHFSIGIRLRRDIQRAPRGSMSEVLEYLLSRGHHELTPEQTEAIDEYRKSLEIVEKQFKAIMEEPND